MPFRPTLTTQIHIGGTPYGFSEHPTAKGMPYGQTGRRATVYQVQDIYGRIHALKVFNRAFRTPQIEHSAMSLQSYAHLPGLQVCARMVLTPEQHSDLIQKYSDLEYAVLMPWANGQTWQEIIVTKKQLTPNQSIIFARGVAAMLANMEKKNLAHCDLSGANLIVSDQGTGLALVDVEEMYAPVFERPQKLPAGSSGYAHQEAYKGLWSPDADRFAGSVILAEILGWCDADILAASGAETYFLDADMQADCPRYKQLATFLFQTWGEKTASLFHRAWFGATLKDCPTFSEWLEALQQAHQLAPVAQPRPVYTMPVTNPVVSPPSQPPLTETSKSTLWWGLGTAAFFGVLVIGILVFSVGAALFSNRNSASSIPPSENYSTQTYFEPTNAPDQQAVVENDPGTRPTATDLPIQPNPTTKTPKPTKAASCPNAPPQRLKVGDNAYVCTKRDSVILREGPAKKYSELKRLVPGADLKIIGGPTCANKWSWWEVETESGFVGWMAEGGDATDPYFLCPSD